MGSRRVVAREAMQRHSAQTEQQQERERAGNTREPSTSLMVARLDGEALYAVHKILLLLLPAAAAVTPPFAS